VAESTDLNEMHFLS